MRDKTAVCGICQAPIYVDDEHGKGDFNSICLLCANAMPVTWEGIADFFRQYRVYCLDHTRRPKPIE